MHIIQDLEAQQNLLSFFSLFSTWFSQFGPNWMVAHPEYIIIGGLQATELDCAAILRRLAEWEHC